MLWWSQDALLRKIFVQDSMASKGLLKYEIWFKVIPPWNMIYLSNKGGFYRCTLKMWSYFKEFIAVKLNLGGAILSW